MLHKQLVLHALSLSLSLHLTKLNHRRLGLRAICMACLNKPVITSTMTKVLLSPAHHRDASGSSWERDPLCNQAAPRWSHGWHLHDPGPKSGQLSLPATKEAKSLPDPHVLLAKAAKVTHMCTHEQIVALSWQILWIAAHLSAKSPPLGRKKREKDDDHHQPSDQDLRRRFFFFVFFIFLVRCGLAFLRACEEEENLFFSIPHNYLRIFSYHLSVSPSLYLYLSSDNPRRAQWARLRFPPTWLS